MDSMDTRGKISPEQVEKSRAALKNPPKPQSREATKKQAIRSLVPEILALQREGYSAKAIAQILSDSGIPISGATLNSYLQRIKSEGDAKRSKRAAGRKDTPPTLAETTPQPQMVPESSATSKAAALTSKGSASTNSTTASHAASTPPGNSKATKEKATFVVKKDTENI